MRAWVYDCWNHIMDAEVNPLRHIPDLQVRHMIMQILAFMWSAVFAIMIADSVMAFGTTGGTDFMKDTILAKGIDSGPYLSEKTVPDPMLV